MEPSSAIPGGQKQDEAPFLHFRGFELVSLSAIIRRLSRYDQQLEAGEVGVAQLHSECSRIKSILEALKCACDKSSSLEYAFFLHFEYRV